MPLTSAVWYTDPNFLSFSVTQLKLVPKLKTPGVLSPLPFHSLEDIKSKVFVFDVYVSKPFKNQGFSFSIIIFFFNLKAFSVANVSDYLFISQLFLYMFVF